MTSAEKIQVIKKRTYGLLNDFFHNRPIIDPLSELVMACNDNQWLIDHITAQDKIISCLKKKVRSAKPRL